MSENSDERYRVFVPESEQNKLSADVTIEERYPAFVMVTASDAAIAEVRKQYPVEPLRRPKGPAALSVAAAEETPEKTRGPYTLVVRFRNPVRPAWLEEITTIGCEHLGTLGSSTIVVQCPTKRTSTRLRKLGYVENVYPYLLETSIVWDDLLSREAVEATVATTVAVVEDAPPATSTTPIHALPGMFSASFFREKDRQAAQKKLEHERLVNVIPVGTTDLLITLKAGVTHEQLNDIANLRNLRSLKEKSLDYVTNDLARKTIADAVIEPNPKGLGLTGNGEIIAVADTGLDTGDRATVHLDFRGRVRHLKSWPINLSTQKIGVDGNLNDGADDRYSGHGTHVCGSVLGNGALAAQLNIGQQISGTAPEAELVFQAIEQTTHWTKEGVEQWSEWGKKPPANGLFGIPDDLADLLQAAFDQDARIHSNSWTAREKDAWGEYNQHSKSVDQFVWDHRDFLVVVAAGNEATKTTPQQKPGSVVSPGTAKNCLTVGACGNGRSGHGIDAIAAFSSRGPTLKGRQKPDVVAPGEFILSTRSSLAQGNGRGVLADAPNAYFFESGTSMATPLVAGCAALVRQYLREKRAMVAPSAALIKAIIIHSAHYVRSATAPAGQLADNEQGWGRVDLGSVLNPPPPAQVLFIDQAQGLPTGEDRQFKVRVAGPEAPLRVTLVYTDFAGADLVNNLNLFVNGPDGTFFTGNDFDGDGAPDSQNNVEGVLIPTPQPGDWTIKVVGSNVPQGPQDFALVVSAAGLVQLP